MGGDKAKIFARWINIIYIELTRVEGEGGREQRGEQAAYLDIYRERPIRLTVRALVPVKEHPKVSPAQQPATTRR